MNRQETIADIRDRNPYQLADDADCGSPDGFASPGYTWLDIIRDRVLDAWESDNDSESEDDWGDVATQIADEMVPIYTHHKWQVFIDVQAYHEDVDEYGGSTLDELSNYVLYDIARRLADQLFTELQAADDEDEE